jgi:hypothetical protein
LYVEIGAAGEGDVKRHGRMAARELEAAARLESVKPQTEVKTCSRRRLNARKCPAKRR